MTRTQIVAEHGRVVAICQVVGETKTRFRAQPYVPAEFDRANFRDASLDLFQPVFDWGGRGWEGTPPAGKGGGGGGWGAGAYWRVRESSVAARQLFSVVDPVLHFAARGPVRGRSSVPQ